MQSTTGRSRTFIWLSAAALVAALVAAPRAARAQGRGVQFTPDGKRVLVNKDVGSDRFAISRNPDNTLTGNVFRMTGEPAFIFCTPLAEPNRYSCSGADPCQDLGGLPRGINAPNLQLTLVNKDVATDRFAISLNEDGTATGNVFRQDGGAAFIFCTPLGGTTFACSGADTCVTDTCIDQYTFIGNVTLPDDFFEVPIPCNAPFTFISEVTLPPTFFVPPEVVALTVTASAALQGFRFTVNYPTAKGGISGSGDNTGCSSNAPNFVSNDLDDGEAIVIVANATNLTFPLQITCTFDENEGQTLTAGDVTITGVSVTENGQAGNPASLSVGVSVD